MSEQPERFVRVGANGKINILMKFWETMPGVSLLKQLGAGRTFRCRGERVGGHRRSRPEQFGTGNREAGDRRPFRGVREEGQGFRKPRPAWHRPAQ